MIAKHLPALLVMVAATPYGLAASPNINPGEWEFQTTMSGMPKNMPVQKFRTCMERNNPVPRDAAAQDGGACKTTYEFISNSTATWTATCKIGNGTTTTQGRGVYRGDTMEATQTTSTHGKTFTMAYNGRRIGACTRK